MASSISSSTILPISLASIIIGFVSFAFTLAIWLHNFWDWFETITDAPNQIQDNFSTLRQALYEEREHLRRARHKDEFRGGKRRGSGVGGVGRGSGEDVYGEGGMLRIINDAVKHLIRDFKRLERPFLITEHKGREKDLEWSYDITQQQYRCDLPHRFTWLRNKSKVVWISSRLSSLQIRRIAVEVSESKLMIADVEGMVRGVDDRLRRVEDRLRM